jgi:hypothetical protein
MPAGTRRLAGVASTTIRTVLAGRRTGVVLGSSSHAVWVRVADSVVVVSTADATRLPNAIEIPVEAASDPFGSVRTGETVEIEACRVSFTGLTVAVGRWWDPRPAVPATTAAALAAALGSLPSDVPDIDGSRLAAALRNASMPGLLAAAEGLLGWGSGLTPQGDDYLAGALAAREVLGPALGDAGLEPGLKKAAGPLAALAGTRTTTFSAALISHAVRGEVAAPAGALLRALAGRGAVEHAHAVLSSVGHSSGPALAAGIVLGARSLIPARRAVRTHRG